MNESLHPDVKKFKIFVKGNPHVLRDVHSGEKSLQDLFEEWMLFGEDDEIWDSYLSQDIDQDAEESRENKENDEDSSTEMELLNMLKKMNLNDVQHHLAQFSTVVGSIQELVSQFKQQTPSHQPGPEQQQEQPPPFSFRED
ncbi:YlbD family protein [Salipaludibacillus daqingensis]|uniref:YlbD family protein n=1 Tax=Salipaludibacillus daqingensis TaxID=3041001 RepID=UPI0024739091|nr:YlbD family protein [Salipaludibacillus daqingensis]